MDGSNWIKLLQRITIPEIKKHPWFLKNLAAEFLEGEQASIQVNSTANYSQSNEEVLAIVEEARKSTEGPKVGENVIGGSMDLDDIDADCYIDDTETSGEFVCAL